MDNNDQGIFKLYESDLLRQSTGDTLRPGGFYLTDLGVKSCNFSPGARVLDVGCGSGATVDRLVSLYGLQALGLDPSALLLESGLKKNPSLNLIQGQGEDLPFPAQQMDGVFAECALSVMADLDQVLQEIFRVLKPGGWLVINDVYAKNPDGLTGLQALKLDSCIRRALPKEALVDKLLQQGFRLVNWMDHTNLLTQLTVNLIMTHGSMDNFWLKTSTCSCSNLDSGSESIDPILVRGALKQAKMGYFQLIAQKKATSVRKG
ncbi:DVU_1556 family methyltransferase [Desulfosporosinus meridiei]|uniref:Methylase involved in ubiquinone/menaquinone biosynthesis n=1 Tax=Desulfosporosinus meridiei (strain ATCC BAA-275 / DSM 13257 / KCTC 12902 / NCIMB 13706 / S10) TaxID=768704 RepID=J7IN18_DESMD|nr:class I SAM-dependent methyltransferase [Desulfosporosinus meridiei]AFQ43192.1 methylase involved in ubiquinone/menaquinone biosynthesis [Desulfosporosinus meridiei DSM 13257]